MNQSYYPYGDRLGRILILIFWPSVVNIVQPSYIVDFQCLKLQRIRGFINNFFLPAGRTKISLEQLFVGSTHR